MKIFKNFSWKIYRRWAKHAHIDDRMIVFDSNSGVNYTGNPRAIYEYLVEHGLDQKYHIIWFFEKGVDHSSLPGNAKVYTYKSIQYYYYTAKAKIWIFDSRNPYNLVKKKNQHYIQTWHGTPLKKLALDIEEADMPSVKSIDSYKKFFRKNTRSWDYLIAQNEFSEVRFRHCFDFNKAMLPTGYPRNDILFHRNDPQSISALKKELGLPADKKIILYAPTYRDNDYQDGVYHYTPAMDFDKMRAALGDSCILIVKFHYFIASHMDFSDYKGFIYSYDTDMDINKLYLVSDEMITDYSSVMFDYSLLHRPMYFFCYDLDEYKDAIRGFYFDIREEAPGPISTTTDELIRDLLTDPSELESQYHEKAKAFYQKFHTYENGTACEQIADLIDAISG